MSRAPVAMEVTATAYMAVRADARGRQMLDMASVATTKAGAEYLAKENERRNKGLAAWPVARVARVRISEIR
jgi:hypothetical protein